MNDLYEHKATIATYLATFLQEKKQHYSKINSLGERVIDSLLIYATSGKMIRGSLFLASYQLFTSKKISEDALKIASCLELIQSALLIHDDIMDQDNTRRGEKTIHKEHAEHAEKNHLPNPSHFGNSMAICIGDIAFFLAFELLSSIKQDTTIKENLLLKLVIEIQSVGLAQMQDVLFGNEKRLPKEHEIIQLYTYKTARYTFSLPLSLGAILANEQKSIIKNVEKIGELLGIIFQIKDDELGLFGDKVKTGKSIGSDIKERKKTLHYLSALENSNEINREKLLAIYNQNVISEDDVEKVLMLIEKSGAKMTTENYMHTLTNDTEAAIKKIPKNSQNFFNKLLISMSKREA